MNKADIRRLTDRLGACPIVAAYLFGSEAKGDAGPLSDIDVAVYAGTALEKPERFDLRLRLTNDLTSLFGRTVEIVVMEDIPLQLRHEIIKTGRLLCCSDDAARIEMERETLSRYLDRRYYDKRHAALLLEKVAAKGLLSA